MIIAYIIAKFEEENGESVDWIKLIEGGIFEFFQRIMLTDLKPEVFREIMSKKEKELNKWVLENFKTDLDALGGGFAKRCSQYFSDINYAISEKRILSAAHCMSTKWEFSIVYQWNSMLYGIDKTKNGIDESFASFDDLFGVKQLMSNKEYYGFLDLCGQLRFQQRWAQAFRVQKTTVLGHMLMVAIFAYLLSLEINASEKRRYNNFYASLLHDLPEILTKDIIKPVKSSIHGLENIIKQYEKKQVDERILPLIPVRWYGEMQYFIEDEFSDKIIENGEVKQVDNAADFDNDKYNAVDGTLIEMCDKLCAYIEASMTLEYGINSSTLIKSKEMLYKKYAGVKKNNLDFKQLYNYFYKAEDEKE
jgi:putative hydrolase of HD superfamily